MLSRLGQKNCILIKINACSHNCHKYSTNERPQVERGYLKFVTGTSTGTSIVC